MIRVHNFARGARGLRVFWLCEEMGLPYQVEMVTFPQSAAYLRLNPLGTVPFLEDDGGVAIHESVAILLYLAQRYGPTPLLPANDDTRLARVLQMTVFGEATLGAGLNTLLSAHFVAPEADKHNWSVRGTEARFEKALSFVADTLGGGPFLTGEQISLADISVACALGIWQGALGKAIPPALVAYRERLSERPAYQRAALRASASEPS